MELIRDRLAGQLAASGMFARVHTGDPEEGDLVLNSEVYAFCSQAVGFLFIRVAGITSLRVTVARGDQTLFDDKIERVVTDADPQYTGSQVTFIEQAMQVTMADSLRESLYTLLTRLERSAPTWGQGGGARGEHQG